MMRHARVTTMNHDGTALKADFSGA